MERSYFFSSEFGFCPHPRASVSSSVNHSHLAGGWGLERTLALAGSPRGARRLLPTGGGERRGGAGSQPQSSRAQPSPRQRPEAQAELTVRNSAGK